MQDLSSPALQPASQPAFVSRRRARCAAVLEQQDTGMNATTRFPANYYGLDMIDVYRTPRLFPFPETFSLPAVLCVPGRAMVMQQPMIEECCFVGAPDEPWRSMPTTFFEDVESRTDDARCESFFIRGEIWLRNTWQFLAFQ